MKKLLSIFLLLLLVQPALAEPWDGPGQQTITYPIATTTHVLGDGVTNARGGEAPAYSTLEPNDIPTNSTILSNWIVTCPNGANKNAANDAVGCGQYSDATNTTGYGIGQEAKARFDCNTNSHAKDDPIVNPGVQGGSSHYHDFIGNTAAAGAQFNATYASLRASGNSSCYGGPLNRTLYWKPTLYVLKGTVPVPLIARNTITYYNCGNLTTDPPKCSRWPRGISFIGGFDMSDPTNSFQHNQIAAIDPGFNSYADPSVGTVNGFVGWQCNTTDATHIGYTAYAPKQSNTHQPYLNDGAGHATLDCAPTTDHGKTVYYVNVEVSSQGCWDGKNLHSPNGRRHMAYTVVDKRISSALVCPEGWYKVPVFIAIDQFAFRPGEMETTFLSCDSMVTPFRGGQCFHFDLIPAWDYGTGDAPGVMLQFFQHCAGLTMHVKNSDGVTYTDLPGDPHECGFGRASATTQMITSTAPDGSSPNPVVNLNPDQSVNSIRHFPIDPGTSTAGAVLHSHQ
jgi:hypothetical protein